MFNDTILTFMQVVKYGSFSKAAQVMFLTPNAVKKRINSLEAQTGILLFHRTNKGVYLTEAGKLLHKDFSVIYEQYQKALERAAHVQNRSDHVLCIGLMNTFSDTFVTSNWYEVRKKLRQYPLHLIYYGNSLNDLNALFMDIGSKIDLCIDLFDHAIAKKYNLSTKKISEYPLYIGIPEDTPSKTGDHVTLDMINGQTLSLLQRGRSSVYDTLHDEITLKYPEITVNRIDDYNIRTLNSCYEHKNYILIAKNQIDLYPFYSFHPLLPERTVSFGVYYSESKQKQAEEFIEKITPIL